MHVVDPNGKEVPAQISNGKVIFAAKAPSVGYAVYDVQPDSRSEDNFHAESFGAFAGK